MDKSMWLKMMMDEEARKQAAVQAQPSIMDSPEEAQDNMKTRAALDSLAWAKDPAGYALGGGIKAIPTTAMRESAAALESSPWKKMSEKMRNYFGEGKGIEGADYTLVDGGEKAIGTSYGDKYKEGIRNYDKSYYDAADNYNNVSTPITRVQAIKELTPQVDMPIHNMDKAALDAKLLHMDSRDIGQLKSIKDLKDYIKMKAMRGTGDLSGTTFDARNQLILDEK